MDALRRFEHLIELIEEKVRDPLLSADEIAEQVAQATFLSQRDASTLFRYNTGETLLNYIKERKFNAAYFILISGGRIRDAVELSGLGTHSAFDKKFFHRFDMSPSEAARKKDESLLTAPFSWNVGMMQDDMHMEAPESDVCERQAHQETRYGMPKDVFDRAIEAYELEALFDLPRMFCDAAYELAIQTGIPLRRAFAILDDLHDYGGNFDDLSDPDEPDEEEITPEEALHSYVFDPYFQFMYIKCGVKTDAACELLDRIPLKKEQITLENPHLLISYAMTEKMEFGFFKRAYEYYVAHAAETGVDFEEDFDKFIEELYIGAPIEIAFERLIPSRYLYSYKDHAFDPIFEHEDSGFPMSMEEARDWSEYPYDEELDEENPYYDLDDRRK